MLIVHIMHYRDSISPIKFLRTLIQLRNDLYILNYGIYYIVCWVGSQCSTRTCSLQYDQVTTHTHIV